MAVPAGRLTGSQAAHSVEQKHQELSGCHGYTPGVALLRVSLPVFTAYNVCTRVRVFILEAGIFQTH